MKVILKEPNNRHHSSHKTAILIIHIQIQPLVLEIRLSLKGSKLCETTHHHPKVPDLSGVIKTNNKIL